MNEHFYKINSSTKNQNKYYPEEYVIVVIKSIACEGVMIPSESLSMRRNTFSTI